jgi:hypothetical protein
MRKWIRIFLVLLLAGVFVLFWGRSAAQSRSDFLHNTAAHKRISCNSCHKMPTANWKAARGYPDVADYPGHAACFSCHRSDFFSGNKPSICAGCHANPGPRGAARLPFPVRSKSTDFSTIFPHDVHQNIIAYNQRLGNTAVAHFMKAGFSIDQQKEPQFNSCALCHQTSGKLPKFTTRELLKSSQALADPVAETFAPAAAFFKMSPDSHASCFSCHYQNQEPIRTNCAGCHSLTKPYVANRVLSRFSLKFDHQSKDHADKDCITCHIRITETGDLKSMKGADVPILTCSTSSCHASQIGSEISKRGASIAAKGFIFQCTYCHTSQIGRFPIPASHKAQ